MSTFVVAKIDGGQYDLYVEDVEKDGQTCHRIRATPKQTSGYFYYGYANADDAIKVAQQLVSTTFGVNEFAAIFKYNRAFPISIRSKD